MIQTPQSTKYIHNRTINQHKQGINIILAEFVIFLFVSQAFYTNSMIVTPLFSLQRFLLFNVPSVTHKMLHIFHTYLQNIRKDVCFRNRSVGKRIKILSPLIYRYRKSILLIQNHSSYLPLFLFWNITFVPLNLCNKNKIILRFFLLFYIITDSISTKGPTSLEVIIYRNTC